MNQQQSCLGKGGLSPWSPISSTGVGQVDGLLIAACPQEILGLLIQGNWLK